MFWQSHRTLGLVLTLIGVVAIFFFTAAPDKEKPEKITVGNITWNQSSQSFDIPVSLQATLAERAASDGYVITTVMHVADARTGATLANLGPQSDPVVLDSTATREGRMAPLVPQSITWDRNGGTFTGPVDLSGETTLVRPDGKIVARDVILIFDQQVD